jgi:hypothetical protein
LEQAEKVKDKGSKISQEFIIFCQGLLAKKAGNESKAIACFLSTLEVKDYSGFLSQSNF